MNSSPINVNYSRKFFKTKTKTMLNSFFNRFYTPYVFVLWFIVAFNLDNCTNVPIIIILMTIVASAQNSFNTYNIWYSDVMLLTEAHEPKINFVNKCMFIVSEFFIHLVCTTLSIWWIDDLHECVPFLRQNQGIAWLIVVILAIILHITQYKLKNKQMEIITKSVYRHVQSVTV